MKRVDPALLWLGIVVLVFADLLFLPVMIYGRDVNSYFLPLENAVHRAWAAGRLPLWFADVSGGKPLLPNPNAGVFYPLRLAAALLPCAAGFKLYLVAHVFLAGWGAIRLARELGATRGGSLVAAVVYAFSGPVLSTVLFSNMLPGAALLPWIAWAARRLAVRPDACRAGVVAALLAADLLAGEPFTIFLAVVFASAFTAAADPELRGRAFRLALAAGGAALLAAGLQLVPTLLYLPQTFRAQVRFRLLATLQWSLSPARLLEWIVPYPFGDPTGFVAWKTWGGRFFDGRPSGYFATLFAGAFAAGAMLHPSARPEDRRLRSALRAVFAISATLASAAVFVPDRMLSRVTRIALRYPEKLTLAAILAIAVWAARAWDAARGDRRIASAFLAGAAFLAIAGLAAAAFRGDIARAALAWTRDGRATLPTVAAGVPRALLEGAGHWALAAAAALLLARSAGRRAPAAAAFLLIAADVALATRRIVATAPERDVLGPPPAVAALRALDPETRFSFLPQAMYLPIAGSRDAERGRRGDRPPEIALRAFAGSLWGRPSVLNSDPDASDLARHGFVRRDLFDVLARSPGNVARFLAGFSVGWVVRFPDAPPLPGAAPAAVAGDVVIDRIPDAVPRFSIAEGWEELPDRPDVEGVLRTARIPPATAVLETGRRTSGADAPGRLGAVSESANGFTAEVACPTGCWLRATRGYWTFRSISIDDVPAAAVPERAALSAVRIPRGAHRVVWTERVPGGAAGAIVSLAGFAAIGAALSRRKG
ncbi:MAG TPA: hypothetical protein VFL12_00575 [Thermoanaerobaculia bacterium]|nr:hypothetical protein [Thermoanaerobaculia bacterium]